MGKKSSRKFTKQMLSSYAKGGHVSREQFEDLDSDLNEDYHEITKNRRF